MLEVGVSTSKSFGHLLARSIQGLKVLLQRVDGVAKGPSANLRVRSCYFRLYRCKKSGKFCWWLLFAVYIIRRRFTLAASEILLAAIFEIEDREVLPATV